MQSLARMLLALVILALVGAVGCVRVKPHQRENLANRALQQNPWPSVQRGDSHVFEVREGTGGATGNAGGGCGCN